MRHPLRRVLLDEGAILDWVALAQPGCCWPWAGLPNEVKGYGIVTVGGTRWYAHRLVWTLTRGPIPPGLFVCHHCDNPPCCNPEHLFLGTHGDNMADRLAKGRYHGGKKGPDRRAGIVLHSGG